MAVRFEVAERGGDRVMIAEHATIAVGDRVLIDDLTATLMRGDRSVSSVRTGLASRR